ncbi:hypothetical protein BGX33_007608 [Mortierella sp. NVP41]|nr:hypothetical protein BGX33_007608 [Mortierella sp. NVP41]
MVLLRSLILSASVAVLATFSNAVPTPSPSVTIEPSEPTPTATPEPIPTPTDPVPHIDPCTILGGLNGTGITYNHVANCYKAIPFDNAQAATTLSTMLTLFKDYYIFTDAALTRKVAEPFSSEPIDIVGEIEKIGRRKYTSDYEFHNDIRLAVDSLRDAHLAYNIACYKAYSFAQHLSLYAPAVDGEQSIRVFKDAAKRGYEDCTVSTINGKDALSYIRNYARKDIGLSHDPNARMNFLLASQGWSAADGVFVDNAGNFAERSNVPETEFVEYQLHCANSTETIELKEEWLVIPQSQVEFTDAASYVANVCLAPTDVAPPAEASLHRRFDPNPKIVKRADPESAPAVTPGAQYSGAEQILAGNATIFYQLKDAPQIGVLVCHTFDADLEGEQKVLVQGLQAFHDRNVTNVIIDLQGNGGGLVALSAFMVQMFFPNKGPFDAAFESDTRVTKPIQELSTVGYNRTEAGFFNAAGYFNLAANGTEPEVYKNNDLFMKPVTLSRNGRRNLYTERTSLGFGPIPAEITASVAAFPWTAKAENIRILTDGRCGSACGMASYFWTALHDVTAYSIGGTKGEDLSMFSFAGASVLQLDQIQTFYKASNVTSPMVDLPYKSIITFSWLEMYGKGRTLPFEYDAELYRPKHRLDYTPENARNRETLWKEVAAASWK